MMLLRGLCSITLFSVLTLAASLPTNTTVGSPPYTEPNCDGKQVEHSQVLLKNVRSHKKHQIDEIL